MENQENNHNKEPYHTGQDHTHTHVYINNKLYRLNPDGSFHPPTTDPTTDPYVLAAILGVDFNIFDPITLAFGLYHYFEPYLAWDTATYIASDIDHFLVKLDNNFTISHANIMINFDINPDLDDEANTDLNPTKITIEIFPDYGS